MTWSCAHGHENPDTHKSCYECGMIASGKRRCTRCLQKPGRWHDAKYECCLACFHEHRPARK